MPQMSFTDAIIHASQDLIYALQNTTPGSPLVKQGNEHKEALITLSKKSRKANPLEVPPRVPFRGEYQEKLHQVNQEINQTKIAPQSKPFTHVEPLRVPIVESFPEEIQPVHPAKNLIKIFTQTKIQQLHQEKENHQK